MIKEVQFTIPVSGIQPDPLTELEQWENELWSKPSEARKTLKKKAKDRRYYANHRQERIAYNTEYNRSHPEQHRETCKKYYENNVEKEAERQRKYLAKNPEKYQAHLAVQRAIRSGALVPQPCEMCGAIKASAHHDDYSKQLDVRWLCHKCHMAWHSKIRKEIA